VPGPREDWRREEEGEGAERWPFKRRRLEGSEEEDRAGLSDEEGVPVVVEGAVAVDGEECRDVLGLGWTRRARGLLAIVVEGPALPDGGWRGVEAPVVEVEREGRRCVLLWRREGSCGSMAMAPSFWRSRILMSRRLICRSS